MLRTTIFRFRILGRAAMALPLLVGLAIAVSAQAVAPSTYTVKPGDTLWGIARVHLGNPFRWQELYRLNSEVVSDPSRIATGTVLRLAPVATPAPSAESRAPVVTQPEAPVPAPAPPRGIVVTAEPDPVPVVSREQGEGDPATALFRRGRVASAQNAFRAYRESRFHPLRAGEFFSSGFLTEGENLPFGTLLGPVTPEQIARAGGRAAVQQFTRVALAPPVGASYAAGDTLLVVDRRDAPVGFGQVLTPTGLVQVIRQDENQAVGDVIAVYGPIREGQSLLPAPKFSDPGPVEYQPVGDGVEGRVLVEREARELRLPQQVLFLDVGSRDGVAVGDLFEARGSADEPMGTFQVVQVRERTSTVKVLSVVSPNLPAGTRVRQVAKLPG